MSKNFNFLSNATWYPFQFDTPFNAVRAVAIWLTLLIIVAFSILLLILKDEKRKKAAKTGAILLVFYSALLALLFFVLSVVKDGKEGEIILSLFIPTAVLIIFVMLTLLSAVFSKSKKLKILFGALTLASFIVVLIFMGIRFSSGESSDYNGLSKEDVNSIGLYLSAAFAIFAVIFFGGAFDKGREGFDTKSVTYAGVSVAMSYALSYLRIVRMPQGGSITPASMLPLMIYSYAFGTKKGVIVGCAYGLLQALQDPSVIHPAQFLLDYPVAFSAIGLSGIFAKNRSLEKLPQLQFALGGIIGGLARFLMHFLAGSFAFAAFSGDQNPFIYSFIYQAGYVLPDVAITIAVGVVIFSSKSFVKFIEEKC